MLKTVGNPSTRYGDQTIIDGNLIIGTSGKGIDFSATPGTGTSELFDDYEEGTWTPQSTANGLSPTSGWYTKIGDTVTAWYSFTVNSSTTSIIRLTGFPFAPSSGYQGVITLSTAQDNAVAPYQWITTPDLVDNTGSTKPGHNLLVGETFAGFFQYKV